MNLLQPIDLYCERLSTDLLAEPLNLFSNAAFLIGALILFQKSRVESGSRKSRILIMAALSLLVGLGSGLFHALPNRLTQAGDVIPILIFVGMSIALYFRGQSQILGPWRKSLALCLGSLILGPLLSRVFGLNAALNQGEFYLGIIPSLAILAFYEGVPEKKTKLIVAGLLFSLAYLARAVDPLICPSFPSGTHFIWHLLTATVAYLIASLEFALASREG